MARRNEYSRDRAPDKDDADGKLWRHWGDGGVGETISARLQGYDPTLPGYVDVQVDGDGVLQTSGSGGGGGGEVTFPVYALELDVADANTTYIGEAAVDSLTSASVWRIKRVVEVASDLTIGWAASATFTQVWDDRVSLTYN